MGGGEGHEGGGSYQGKGRGSKQGYGEMEEGHTSLKHFEKSKSVQACRFLKLKFHRSNFF